jgi:MFS family permease
MINHIKQEVTVGPMASLIAGLGFLYIFLLLNLIAPLNHIISSEYQLSLTQVGLFTSSYLLGVAVFVLPAGMLIDYYGPFKLILIGLAMSILMTFVFANSASLSLLILSRFLSGIFHNMVFLSSVRIASEIYKRKRAFYIGLTITTGLVGGIISQYPFVKLITLISWHAGVNIVGCFGILIWLLIFFYFKYIHSIPIELHKVKIRKHELYSVLKNPLNLIFGLYACLMDLPAIVIGTSWGNRFIMEFYHQSNLSASKVVLWVYLGLMIGSPLSGIISDRFKNRKKVMIIASALLFILAFVWGNKSLSLDELGLITFLIGVLSGFQVLSYSCLAEINHAHKQSFATGYASLVIMGGNAVLIPFIGWLMGMNRHHLYAALIVIPLLLLINVVLISIFGKETMVMPSGGS